MTSTAGDATLSVADGGRLTNGAFTLREPLQVSFSKASWTGPVSNDPVTIAFTQHIGANERCAPALQQDAHVHAVHHDALK